MFRSETEYGTKAGIPQSCCSKSQACDLRSTSDDPDNIFKVWTYDHFYMKELSDVISGDLPFQDAGCVRFSTVSLKPWHDQKCRILWISQAF